jgi:hypothetical protein
MAAYRGASTQTGVLRDRNVQTLLMVKFVMAPSSAPAAVAVPVKVPRSPTRMVKVP